MKLTPQKKGGFWYLIRRVPVAVGHLDRRKLVKLTTGIRIVDDPRGLRAKRAVMELNALLEQDWADLAAGREMGQRRRYESARTTAANLGLPYLTARELAAGPIDEIHRRMDLLEHRNLVNNSRAVLAVLGGVDKPLLMLSDLVEAFEAEQKTALMALSPDQLKRWRNPKARAAKNLIDVIGDKALARLTRDDALTFRDHWKRKVLAGEAEIGTANKQVGHIAKMLRTVEDARRLGISLEAFSKLRLEGEETGQRTAYEPEFVQKVILADGALDGLNDEARRVVYVIADTGLRLSEVVNLLPHHIHLDADVPHVEIVAEGRKLKTRHSARKMPLLGCALAAMRLQPQGFPRYRDKAASLSALVNKTMDARGMRPTLGHSLYSLRHTFEDRLTALDPPDKIIAVLMGHKHQRPKYGAGPTLEHLQSWLLKLAFEPPPSL
jgi:integrase